jgi:predicted transposase YdaD
MRSYFEINLTQKIGPMEWLKVTALSSNPSTAKEGREEGRREGGREGGREEGRREEGRREGGRKEGRGKMLCTICKPYFVECLLKICKHSM